MSKVIVPETHLSEFDPYLIEWQGDVIDYIEDFDFEQHGRLDLLFSGTLGSAKSTLGAHLAIKHCLELSESRCYVGRRVESDLKKTLWQEILDHVAMDFKEGRDYKLNRGDLRITFKHNNSELCGVSWANVSPQKFRSHKISMFVVEELTENEDENDEACVRQIMSRLERLLHIKRNMFIGMCNPDDPEHWVYKMFFENQSESTMPFVSSMMDNPFLPLTYRNNVLKSVSPSEAQRLVYGKWVSLKGKTIYREYDKERQYRDEDYTLMPGLPVWFTWDFNIGEGKPISAIFFQYDPQRDHFHFFNEVVLDSTTTEDAMYEVINRKILDARFRYCLTGDSAGKHRDTRSKRDDYMIIQELMKKHGARVEYCVLPSNPPIRTRHGLVNRYCKNALGDRRLTIWKCPTASDGLRLTKLKDGGQYIEDDSKRYQHISTAIGYGIHSCLLFNKKEVDF